MNKLIMIGGAVTLAASVVVVALPMLTQGSAPPSSSWSAQSASYASQAAPQEAHNGAVEGHTPTRAADVNLLRALENEAVSHAQELVRLKRRAELAEINAQIAEHRKAEQEGGGPQADGGAQLMELLMRQGALRSALGNDVERAVPVDDEPLKKPSEPMPPANPLEGLSVKGISGQVVVFDYNGLRLERERGDRLMNGLRIAEVQVRSVVLEDEGGRKHTLRLRW